MSGIIQDCDTVECRGHLELSKDVVKTCTGKTLVAEVRDARILLVRAGGDVVHLI